MDTKKLLLAAAASKVKALVLSGTPTGAALGWDVRRGVGEHDKSSQRTHEGYGGSKTPGVGDRVLIKGNVAAAGKQGVVKSTAPNGGVHDVQDRRGQRIGYYHSSNLRVKNMTEDAAIAFGLADALRGRVRGHRAVISAVMSLDKDEHGYGSFPRGEGGGGEKKEGGGGKSGGSEGSGKALPKDVNPTKLQNHLVKELEGRKGRVESNPYSDRQHKEVWLKPEKAEQLKTDLTKAGWKTLDPGKANIRPEYADKVRVYEHEKHPGISIRVNDGDKDVDATAQISGPKKAKASNLPYYD